MPVSVVAVHPTTACTAVCFATNTIFLALAMPSLMRLSRYTHRTMPHSRSMLQEVACKDTVRAAAGARSG